MTGLQGTYDERFEPLAAMLRRHQDDGTDEGVSLGVMLRGEPVVDLWAGHRDLARTQPWERDTLCFVYSSSKVVTIVSVADQFGRTKDTTLTVPALSGSAPGLGRTSSLRGRRRW